MSNITKALIACGGWSTRFLPAVKTYAKHLVPVLDRPQLQHVVTELIGAGITDICIVHRQGEETIKKHFSQDSVLDEYLTSVGKSILTSEINDIISKVKFTFLAQSPDLPYGNGTPILVAKEFVGQDPFVYLWGDDVTIEDSPGSFLKSAIDLYQKYQPAVVECVQEVPWPEVYRYGTVKYQPDPNYPNRISALLEKLPQDQAPSNIIQGARFIVSSKLLPVLEKTATSRGELWFADAVNYLAANDIVITHNYTENNAFWATTGDPLNWLKVNLILALKDDRFAKDIKEFIIQKSQS